MKYRQQTYLLMNNSPTTSYVAATFLPTIGQLAHQYLSNAATPELGMIPQGLRGQIAGLHIAKGHKQQTNTAGFHRLSIDKPSQHSPKTNHCTQAITQLS